MTYCQFTLFGTLFSLLYFTQLLPLFAFFSSLFVFQLFHFDSIFHIQSLFILFDITIYFFYLTFFMPLSSLQKLSIVNHFFMTTHFLFSMASIPDPRKEKNGYCVILGRLMVFVDYQLGIRQNKLTIQINHPMISGKWQITIQ